jgi:cold shock CspA family protein
VQIFIAIGDNQFIFIFTPFSLKYHPAGGHAMETGMIKMFDQFNGYGFIATDAGDEVYFSKKDIHPKYKNVFIKENMKVGFDIKREMKGDRAVNVRVL